MTLPPREGWTERHQEAAEAGGWSSWEAWVAHLEEEKGHPICGRMKKGARSPCTRTEAWGVDGKEVGACKFHGGRAPAGMEHPNYQHGRRARSPSVVGASLRQRVERFMDLDPRRTLQVATATMMARLEELWERVDRQSVGPKALANVRALMDEVRGVPDDEPQRMAGLLDELDSVVRGGSHSDETWQEIYVVMERLRGLSEAWRKVMTDAQEMVERSRALVLVDRVGASMVEILEDLPLDAEDRKEARRKVAEVVATYLTRPGLPSGASSSGNGDSSHPADPSG